VYSRLTIKRKPHHPLPGIKARFASVDSLDITRAAILGARALGYGLEDIMEVVQALEPQDFLKSETAHSPPNPRVWHDAYALPWDGRLLYLKFAGETLIDVTLTSFKERLHD
jgi:motility quorum-sensing regulator/GCU-specific mRNA interferase toxin